MRAAYMFSCPLACLIRYQTHTLCIPSSPGRIFTMAPTSSFYSAYFSVVKPTSSCTVKLKKVEYLPKSKIALSFGVKGYQKLPVLLHSIFSLGLLDIPLFMASRRPASSLELETQTPLAVTNASIGTLQASQSCSNVGLGNREKWHSNLPVLMAERQYGKSSVQHSSSRPCFSVSITSACFRKTSSINMFTGQSESRLLGYIWCFSGLLCKASRIRG